MSRLADLVGTSSRVAGTRSRKAKIGAIAGYLAEVEPDDIENAVAFLTGVIPHGALGVGWATVGALPSPASEPSLRLTNVDETFRRLLEASGPGSNEFRRSEVADLMRRATDDEQRFLLGLITGEIRQGALEGIMIDAVAAASGASRDVVRRAVMLDGRVWSVARIALREPERLSEVGLVLFRPIQPMLSQSAESVKDAMEKTGPAAIEWKLDGIRVQVHRDDTQVEIYTRNLNRVTDRLPEIVESVLALDCRSAVLDGEALHVDSGGKPARFQDTAGRFGTDEMDQRGLRPFYFDLLHLDGVDLIDEPLGQRRSALDRLVGDAAIPHVEVGSPAEADEVMEAALGARHEGVMVKAVDSTYEAGRRGAAWVKVKPVHTLDLVVLAAEWGHGRRQGWLSNLHLGARGEDGFVMVGKTFKGLTDQLLEWQTGRIQELEERRTKSTVWVRPELVVEIALDGVQASSRYPGGVALRFARVRGYRPDKDPTDADSIETVRALGGL